MIESCDVSTVVTINSIIILSSSENDQCDSTDCGTNAICKPPGSDVCLCKSGCESIDGACECVVGNQCSTNLVWFVPLCAE